MRWLDWNEPENVSEPVFPTNKTDQTVSIFNKKYNAEFRSLVTNGYFSSDPDDILIRRSVITNYPGALNISNWQKSFAGFVGATPGDRVGNQTSIYVTPEHGIAAWFNLIIEIYGFTTSTKFSLSELAKRYSGIPDASDLRVKFYLTGWEYWTGGGLKKSSSLDLGKKVICRFWPKACLLTKPVFLHRCLITRYLRVLTCMLQTVCLISNLGNLQNTANWIHHRFSLYRLMPIDLHQHILFLL